MMVTFHGLAAMNLAQVGTEDSEDEDFYVDLLNHRIEVSDRQDDMDNEDDEDYENGDFYVDLLDHAIEVSGRQDDINNDEYDEYLYDYEIMNDIIVH